jgi:hypothetical protein
MKREAVYQVPMLAEMGSYAHLTAAVGIPLEEAAQAPVVSDSAKTVEDLGAGLDIGAAADFCGP